MLDDDVARDLALFAGLFWEERDREVLAPLIDATMVWAEEAQLDAIALPIVEAVWGDGLCGDIERALDDLAGRGSALAAAVTAAREDLALGPERSRLALAYVKQAAVELADEALLPGSCLCCFDDALGIAPLAQHEQIALDAAVAIVTHVDAAFGAREPNEAELAAAHARVSAMATLASASLPRFAAALREVEIDAVWRAARIERRAAVAAWN